ncbi:GntR family transcriptional regulator [Brevibacterium sp. 91QC2O2]|uniref:GntR family transcriptional regulator n=1 Tax=Brevibacterium sp. 91QC2O2 TaxID=2968458 RepID=UPI00211BAACE|nr:GntR family transcriptional regulator [Brevibacterium sp. 91QC2O2]MCQ9367122.1 GntR family transcriptional regulator [Brevibacterium sp. 91QC2O2]
MSTPGTAKSDRAKQDTVAAVYESISERISAKDLPPDTRLNMDRLARELGVSQTPVREALRMLEGAGLVVAAPRGYTTTGLLDGAALRDMYEVRLLLEPWAAGAAATSRVGNPGRAMLAELDRFRALEAAGAAGDELVRQMSHHDEVFHRAIFDSVDNPFLTTAFTQLHAHLHLYRLYPPGADSTATITEHQAIAQAIADADPAAARAAMEEHLRGSLDRFAQGIEPAQRPGIAQIRSGRSGPNSPPAPVG